MRRRTLRVIHGAMFLVALASALAPSTLAATPRRTWQVAVASGGTNITGILVLYPNNAGTMSVTVHGLTPGTTYHQSIYKGTCAAPTTLVRLADLRTDGMGDASRTSSLSPINGATIWSVGPAGTVAYRVASGKWARCGALTYPRATRVEIAKYGIDLPVIYQASDRFPYCNVAMYAAAFSQPGEAGPTFVYAHARTGMFLPLLVASRSKDGAAMLGMTVKVWTSDSKVYLYTVTRVIRHLYKLPPYDPAEQLWLQTSEGPVGTHNKLILMAKRTGVADASAAASHPRAHVVTCV
jgi:hypothetical protein